MKKIAFYVEGRTEQLFISKLLKEIAGRARIAIELQSLDREGNTKEIHPKTYLHRPNYYALIFNCKGDGGVKPRILQDYERLINEGYTEVIGIRDLHPIPIKELNKLRNDLKNGVLKNGRQVTQPLPTHAEIIVAVCEIEAWFLSESKHFECIHNNLTNSFIVSSLGFDPRTEDMRLRPNPAKDLHDIYQLAGKAYLSRSGYKRYMENTIECLDYEEIYMRLPKKIKELKDLISKIDHYVSSPIT